MKKIICLIAAVLTVLSLGACRDGEAPKQTPSPTPVISSESAQNEAFVYVGRGEDYKSYKVSYSGDMTADMLILKLSEVTGWNLTLSEPVISGKSGMTIDFSKLSSVYTGRAPGAKDEFEIDDKDDLIYTVLDSVAYTLRRNFVLQETEDTLFEVTYSVEGENISAGKKTFDKAVPYTPDLALEYDESRHTEFLTNRLSNYYDTPSTDYVKYGEEYDDGELDFIYRAVDKKTGEVLGVYKFPSDLSELSLQEPDGDFEEIWSRDMYGD